jgi:hypothetical protein
MARAARYRLASPSPEEDRANDANPLRMQDSVKRFGRT